MRSLWALVLVLMATSAQAATAWVIEPYRADWTEAEGWIYPGRPEVEYDPAASQQLLERLSAVQEAAPAPWIPDRSELVPSYRSGIPVHGKFHPSWDYDGRVHRAIPPLERLFAAPTTIPGVAEKVGSPPDLDEARSAYQSAVREIRAGGVMGFNYVPDQEVEAWAGVAVFWFPDEVTAAEFILHYGRLRVDLNNEVHRARTNLFLRTADEASRQRYSTYHVLYDTLDLAEEAYEVYEVMAERSADGTPRRTYRNYYSEFILRYGPLVVYVSGAAYRDQLVVDPVPVRQLLAALDPPLTHLVAAMTSQPPEVAFVAPSPEEVFRIPAATGTLMTRVELEIKAGSAPITSVELLLGEQKVSLPAREGRHQQELALIPGSHPVEVRVADELGNTARAQITLTGIPVAGLSGKVTVSGLPLIDVQVELWGEERIAAARTGPEGEFWVPDWIEDDFRVKVVLESDRLAVGRAPSWGDWTPLALEVAFLDHLDLSGEEAASIYANAHRALMTARDMGVESSLRIRLAPEGQLQLDEHGLVIPESWLSPSYTAGPMHRELRGVGWHLLQTAWGSEGPQALREGFAVFFACLVENSPLYWFQAESPLVVNLDDNRHRTPWLAVAGLLWDLVDPVEEHDDDRIQLTPEELWKVFSTPVEDIRGLRRGLIATGIGTPTLDRLLAAHGLFDLDANRFQVPSEGYVTVRLVDHQGQPVPWTELQVRLSSPAPMHVYDLSYELTVLDGDRVSLFLPSAGVAQASLIVGQQEPWTVTNWTYWEAALGKVESLGTVTFTVSPPTPEPVLVLESGWEVTSGRAHFQEEALHLSPPGRLPAVLAGETSEDLLLLRLDAVGTLRLILRVNGEVALDARLEAEWEQVVDLSPWESPRQLALELYALTPQGYAILRDICPYEPPPEIITTLRFSFEADALAVIEQGKPVGSLRGLSRPGIHGQAFFSSDKVGIAFPNPLLDASGLTVQAWFYYEEATGGWIWSGGPSLGVLLEDGKLVYHVAADRSMALRGSAVLRPGRWHQAVLVYDGVEVRGYANGQLDARAPLQGTLVVAEEWRMGFFSGGIDEVLVDSVPRSHQEVIDAYRSVRGDPLTQWRSLSGTWEVRNGAFHETSTGRGSKLLLLEDLYTQDRFSIEVEVCVVTTGSQGHAGFVWGGSDEANFNALYVRPHWRQVVYLSRSDGRTTEERTLRATTSVNVPFRMRADIDRVTGTCAVFINGNSVGTIQHPSIGREGLLGLLTWDSGGWFRNFKVTVY